MMEEWVKEKERIQETEYRSNPSSRRHPSTVLPSALLRIYDRTRERTKSALVIGSFRLLHP
jgi:hypothetical protein